MRRQSILTGVGVAMLLIIISAALLSWEFAFDRANTPPGDVTTLDEFRAWNRSAGESIPIQIDGKNYTVVFGAPPILPLKDALPGYLFDEEGTLVSWSPEALDYGVDSQFWNKARGVLVEMRGGISGHLADD